MNKILDMWRDRKFPRPMVM